MRLSHLKFFLVSLFVSTAYTQNFDYSVQYTKRTGMLSNLAYYGIFDQNGFLWVCQSQGLSRFNGTDFTHFTVQDGLPDNDIIYVTEDTKGTIWAQPFQREAAFLKRNTPRFQNVNTIIHPDTVKKDQTYRIFVLKNDKVALVTEQGVIRIIQNDKWTTSYYTNNIAHLHKLHLSETADNKLVLLCSGRKFIIDQRNKTIRSQLLFQYARLVFDRDWICFQGVVNGPLLLCKNIQTGESFPVKDIHAVHRFGIFKSGVVINQQGSDLSFFDFKTKKTSPMDSKAILAHALENKSGTVRVLITGDNGIHIQSKETFSGKHFMEHAPAFFYLNNHQVFISDAVGNLLNLPGGAKRNISNNVYKSTTFAERIGDSDVVYGSISPSPNTSKLFGKISTMGAVKDVYILNDSIRYIGTFKTACIFNTKSRKIRSIYPGRTTSISAGPNGSIFIGTIQGLKEVTATGKLIDWSETGRFKSIRITDLCYRKNVLWVATAGDGLSAIYNGKSRKILSAENGTSRDHIECVEESDNKQLYIGYVDGAEKLIYEFKQGKLTLRNLVTLGIFKDEGIRKFLFYNKLMYGLGYNSLFQFDTRKHTPVRKFQLQLTRLSINKLAQKIQPKTYLKPGKYNLQIELSTQNYQRLPVRYRYRVNRESWTYTSNGNISLDQLGSGEYQIMIQVLSNYNLPSDSRIITVSIDYPFYSRKEFLLGLLISLLITVYLSVRYFLKRRYQKINDKILQQSKLRELELIALKAQINPHFVFNCLNSIKGLIYRQRMVEADLYIDRFAQLFRNTLEASYEHDYPLSSEISYLRAYLEIEQMSMNYKFDFEFIIDPQLDINQTLIPAMLLQPYVENSVKHGVSVLRDQKGLITISFEKRGNYLICTVRDNGPGRKAQHPKPAGQHTGKGISITEKRAKLYEIETEFTEHATGGTSVILKLTITKHYD
ncbi:histidine kinase [Fluviicola sp.]|uniref:sensor histidine kinase n=1 Tax=Fluviicola sp. TaxID=1917219 RepID=UPI002609DA32|nr:histidine kinase [Fluviicola sp.]